MQDSSRKQKDKAEDGVTDEAEGEDYEGSGEEDSGDGDDSVIEEEPEILTEAMLELEVR